jgi:transaldolase
MRDPARRGPAAVNPLRQLREAGQSVWLDYLRRSLIENGGLARLIAEDAVAGLTSNPTIFARAIIGSSDYDRAIGALAEAGAREPRDVFYALALEDVRRAADLFRPRWEACGGADGYVSFELEPSLAHDSAGSVAAALALIERIGRPNLMIKVPGTPAGAAAVEELTAAGVNVNITLLFAVEMYEQVALAYMSGLERRLAAGAPVNGLASVASFFVSRVDSAVDPLLPAGSPLRGSVGIANARRAYARFRTLLAGERWQALARAGARPQRPLWASTGTKDPAFSDVRYVEALVGPDTVNTMPEATLDAFRDHGRVRARAASEGLDEAEAILDPLPGQGVNLGAVGERLLAEGLAAFERDLARSLEAIAVKLGTLPARRARPGAPAPAPAGASTTPRRQAPPS